MTETEALALAKSQGATHIQRLRNGSFIAFRPSRVQAISDDAAGILVKMGKGKSWHQTLFPVGFKYATRHFSCNGAGYYSSEGYDINSWVLCREMHCDVEVI